MSMTFAIVEQCGYYPEDYRDWKRKPDTYKTLVNFKLHFTLRCKEVRQSSDTAKSGGYTIFYCRRQEEAAINVETTTVLANIATATQSNRDSISSLTTTITSHS